MSGATGIGQYHKEVMSTYCNSLQSQGLQGLEQLLRSAE